jgi:predicted metal-dependent HD superfamily phosphohydrolase
MAQNTDLSLPENLLAGLRRRYQEPQRHYHTMAHVQALLDGLQQFRHLAAAPRLVEAAIWFHDAVYEPAKADNEPRSAALAEQQLTAAGWPAEAVQRVVKMVLATQRHLAPREDADAWLFLDLDLSVLGREWAVYEEYRQAVRREYAHVQEGDFRAGRAAILTALLQRETLYATPELRVLWEQSARDNLRRELALLE